MTPNDIGQILKELGGLKVEVRELHTDVREIKADGKETKAEVKRTNGRVTSIEQRHAIEDNISGRADKWSERRWAIVTGATVGAIVTALGFALTIIF